MSRPGQRPIVSRRRWLAFRAGMRPPAARARSLYLASYPASMQYPYCMNSRGSEGRGSRGGFLGAGARRDERAAVNRNCRRSSSVSSLSRQRRKTSSFEGDSPVRRLRGIAGGRRSGWVPGRRERNDAGGGLCRRCIWVARSLPRYGPGHLFDGFLKFRREWEVYGLASSFADCIVRGMFAAAVEGMCGQRVRPCPILVAFDD